jgi:hypothetical protein
MKKLSVIKLNVISGFFSSLVSPSRLINDVSLYNSVKQKQQISSNDFYFQINSYLLDEHSRFEQYYRLDLFLIILVNKVQQMVLQD